MKHLPASTATPPQSWRIVPSPASSLRLHGRRFRHSAATADRDGHVTFDSEHQRQDGTCFPVRVDLTVIRNRSGDPVSRVAFVQDLTAQRRAEHEIRQLNSDLENRVRERTAQLEAANRELEAFSYSVSHDLRAPLRGIDGWSLALAEDYAGQLDQRAQQYLDRVRTETQRMGLLIDDMLQLSRVSRSSLEFVPVDLSAIAEEIAATDCVKSIPRATFNSTSSRRSPPAAIPAFSRSR